MLIKSIKKLVFCQLIIGILVGFLLPLTIIQAGIEPLAISNINIAKTDHNATITWRVNRPAYGKVQYGLSSNNYSWTIQTNLKKEEQTITIFGLLAETDYYLRITAIDEYSEVISFEQRFKTTKESDNKSPTISKVQVVYITGTTATIQWLTDEPATSEIEYGKTENYGLTKTSSQKVIVHDLTITGLDIGTYYHFLVKSKDKNNNIARWHDMTFRTNIFQQAENDDLIIYAIQPVSENDVNVTKNSAVISWRTNKLTQGWVNYGTTSSYGKTIATDSPRSFSHSVILTGLEPAKIYYFEIQVKDVFNKQIKSSSLSFQTKPADGGGMGSGTFQQSQGQILGATYFEVNLEKDFGFYGLYYNLTKNRPDMELWKGTEIPHNKVARQNDWYDSQYFSFSRIDPNLDFGKNFLPVNEGKPGDPFHFAVNWRAIISVPKNDYYTYKVTSDDDSWVFVDDKLTSDLNGVHRAKTDQKEIYLTAGYHKLEIYYAERSRSGAIFSFVPDSRLKFHPLPEGATIADILGYNQSLKNPQILGVSNINEYSSSLYVCNPNLGYTKFKALYKATDSPDIWAILVTGQKHYITSPMAFNQYQCNWSEVKIVSKKILAGYPNANLVRTPTDPMIYYLFQRPDKKWLKIRIPSPTIFVSYPDNYWGNVARVNALDIQAYPDAQLIKVADKPEIYLIEGRLKRYIKSEAVFKRLGYDWAEVVELSQIHLDSYEDGLVID